MEHRKFKTRVKELVDELTAAQAKKLIEALSQRGDGEEVHRQIEQALDNELKCPRCSADHIQRWGIENELQRYKCMTCKKTFNALPGTKLARLRKKKHWLSFAAALNSSVSVRRAAGLVKINATTSFLWRHSFLKTQNKSKYQSLDGIVEVDEFFILESLKGERNLPRAPRKRGGKAGKPGLSAELVPILIARDRTGRQVDGVLPDRSQKSVSAVLKDVISKPDALLCMDGDPAFIAFAEREKIEYELIIASRGEHVHEGVLHIQNVNGTIRRFRQWLDRFNGVATKYLPSYLGWRRGLEQSGTKITATGTLAAALC